MKMIIHDDQVGFISGMQDHLTFNAKAIYHINRIKEKNYTIIWIGTEKNSLTQLTNA